MGGLIENPLPELEQLKQENEILRELVQELQERLNEELPF